MATTPRAGAVERLWHHAGAGNKCPVTKSSDVLPLAVLVAAASVQCNESGQVCGFKTN